MDGFPDSELFDDEAPWVSAPQGDEGADPLTVSADSPSPRLHSAGALRRVVYVVAALAMLVAVVLALRAERPSPGRLHHETPYRHHPHPRTPRRHKPIRMHTRATVRRATTGAIPSKVVVELPSSGPERPTGTEGVGIARPSSTPSVGNTEQFGYLGR